VAKQANVHVYGKVSLSKFKMSQILKERVRPWTKKNMEERRRKNRKVPLKKKDTIVNF
jgi:hypothetical protein